MLLVWQLAERRRLWRLLRGQLRLQLVQLLLQFFLLTKLVVLRILLWRSRWLLLLEVLLLWRCWLLL